MVLKELISMDSVKREEENKRSVLFLTSRGEEANRVCCSSRKKVFQEVFDGLSEHQRGGIREILTFLNSKLDEDISRMLSEQHIFNKDNDEITSAN